MVALITGASSGIGRDMAKILAARNCELILVARNEQLLNQLADSLDVNCTVIATDLSEKENCINLFEQVKDMDIDILINNAGYGLFGRFDKTDLEEELSLIAVNVQAVHILTKLFLKKFKSADKGYILNVASSAAFLPGPMLSSYYASKAYVLRLSLAVYEELRREKSRVSISTLCPGPVRTNFDKRAGVRFSVASTDSYSVALKAISGMFKKHLVIIPGITMRAGVFLSRFVPNKLLLKICYHIQKRKE